MTGPSGRLSLLFVVVFGCASVAGLGTQAQKPQWTPSPPTNLQVLPKDIPLRQLIQTMRVFTQGLGVRCQHCHVFKGNDPDDLSTFAFASDEKEQKKTARVMLRMGLAINNELLKGVGEPRPGGAMKVTCYTCHRGRRSRRPVDRRPSHEESKLRRCLRPWRHRGDRGRRAEFSTQRTAISQTGSPSY